jgi:hypothetical protein
VLSDASLFWRTSGPVVIVSAVDSFQSLLWVLFLLSVRLCALCLYSVVYKVGSPLDPS